MPVQPGKCKSFLKRFYFDQEAKRCKEFTYGGCGGNSNNFQTLLDCEKRCA